MYMKIKTPQFFTFCSDHVTDLPEPIYQQFLLSDFISLSISTTQSSQFIFYSSFERHPNRFTSSQRKALWETLTEVYWLRKWGLQTLIIFDAVTADITDWFQVLLKVAWKRCTLVSGGMLFVLVCRAQ